MGESGEGFEALGEEGEGSSELEDSGVMSGLKEQVKWIQRRKRRKRRG